MMRTLQRRHRRNAILREARMVSPRFRAQLFRTTLYGGETDTKLLLGLAELALEGGDPSIPKYLDALLHGRRIKTASYPTTMITIDGHDADLVYEVESAFTNEEGESR